MCSLCASALPSIMLVCQQVPFYCPLVLAQELTPLCVGAVTDKGAVDVRAQVLRAQRSVLLFLLGKRSGVALLVVW